MVFPKKDFCHKVSLYTIPSSVKFLPSSEARLAVIYLFARITDKLEQFITYNRVFKSNFKV